MGIGDKSNKKWFGYEKNIYQNKPRSTIQLVDEIDNLTVKHNTQICRFPETPSAKNIRNRKDRVLH